MMVRGIVNANLAGLADRGRARECKDKMCIGIHSRRVIRGETGDANCVGTGTAGGERRDDCEHAHREDYGTNSHGERFG